METDCMISWSQCCHFVAISSVFKEKQFDFLSNLRIIGTSRLLFWICIYLDRRQEGAPFMNELCKGTIWATFLDLAHATEYGQFIVSHTHISLCKK